jgi:hypothetical protein
MRTKQVIKSLKIKIQRQDLSDWLAVVKQAAEGRKDMSKETVAIEEELRKSGQHIRPEDLDFDDKEILGSGMQNCSQFSFTILFAFFSPYALPSQ